MARRNQHWRKAGDRDWRRTVRKDNPASILSVAVMGGLIVGAVSLDAERLFKQVGAAVGPDRSGEAYYSGCNAARAAGVAPIYRGQPGYRPEMDGDSDGIACEPYRGS